MSNSEEVSLGSGQVEEKTVNTNRDVNHIEMASGDMTGIITPGMSNEAIVDTLLNVSEDALIPWEECVLPSKGIYYGWPDGVIKVRAMSQTAEKVLATQRLSQSGQALDRLFEECVQFPTGFSSGDLLLGDRVFLLYYIRGITHGNEYEFAITCPKEECGSVSTHTYDLNELAQTIVWARSENGVEPFKIELPYLSKITGRIFTVGVRLLRGYDTNELLARKKARKKMFAKPGGVRNRGTDNRKTTTNEVLDESITENLNKMIVDVMGVTDHFKIRAFVDKLHSQDTAAIREWLRSNTPGIDNTVAVTCPECELEFTVELPITESFFRPSKSGRMR